MYTTSILPVLTQIGAKVLLLKNLDSSSQLVNGATGVVTEFVEASGRKLPKVGNYIVGVNNNPVRKKWFL